MSTRKVHLDPAVLQDARAYLAQSAARRARAAYQARNPSFLHPIEPAALYAELRSEYEIGAALRAGHYANSHANQLDYGTEPDSAEYVLPPDAWIPWEN